MGLILVVENVLWSVYECETKACPVSYFCVTLHMFYVHDIYLWLILSASYNAEGISG